MIKAILKVDAPKGELLLKHFLLVLGSTGGVQEVLTVAITFEVVNHELECLWVPVQEDRPIIKLVHLHVESIGGALALLDIKLLAGIAEHCEQARLWPLKQRVFLDNNIRATYIKLDQLIGTWIHILDEELGALVVEASLLGPIELVLLERELGRRLIGVIEHCGSAEVHLVVVGGLKSILEYTLHTDLDDWAA